MTTKQLELKRQRLQGRITTRADKIQQLKAEQDQERAELRTLIGQLKETRKTEKNKGKTSKKATAGKQGTLPGCSDEAE